MCTRVQAGHAEIERVEDLGALRILARPLEVGPWHEVVRELVGVLDDLDARGTPSPKNIVATSHRPASCGFAPVCAERTAIAIVSELTIRTTVLTPPQTLFEVVAGFLERASGWPTGTSGRP